MPAIVPTVGGATRRRADLVALEVELGERAVAGERPCHLGRPRIAQLIVEEVESLQAPVVTQAGRKGLGSLETEADAVPTHVQVGECRLR